MKIKGFWLYFLIGAAIGVVVGLMKNNLGIWLGVGAGIGLIVSLIIGKKIKAKQPFKKGLTQNMGPDKIMWIGFFMLFPIMFFANQLKGSFWYDVFGILAVMGAFILIINFVKLMKKKKK